MSSSNHAVNGWEIRRRDDGSFGVYDLHGLVAGPFGRRESAVNAALLLPKHPEPAATMHPLTSAPVVEEISISVESAGSATGRPPEPERDQKDLT